MVNNFFRLSLSSKFFSNFFVRDDYRKTYFTRLRPDRGVALVITTKFTIHNLLRLN